MLARPMGDHTAIEYPPSRTTTSKNIIMSVFLSTESDPMTFLEFRVESLPVQDNCQPSPANYRLVNSGNEVRGHVFMDGHKMDHSSFPLSTKQTKNTISQILVSYSKAIILRPSLKRTSGSKAIFPLPQRTIYGQQLVEMQFGLTKLLKNKNVNWEHIKNSTTEVLSWIMTETEHVNISPSTNSINMCVEILASRILQNVSHCI